MKSKVYRTVQKILNVGITVLVFTVLAFCLNLTFVKTDYRSPLTDLNENWTLTLGDQVTQVHLPDEVENKSLQPIVLERTMKEGELPAYSAIMFHGNQAEVHVYLNDEEIYSYTAAQNRWVHIWPSTLYHIVTLPNDVAGKKLKIVMEPTYAHTAGHLDEILGGQEASLRTHLLDKSFGVVLCAEGLLFMSFIFAGLVLAFKKADKAEKNRAFRLTFFLITTGLWSIVNSDMKQLLITDPVIGSVINESTFFLIPVLFSGYVMTFEEVNRYWTSRYVSYLCKMVFIISQIVLLLGGKIFQLHLFNQIGTLFLVCNTLVCLYHADRDSIFAQDMKPLLIIFLGLLLEVQRYLFVDKDGMGFLISLSVLIASFANYCGIVKRMVDQVVEVSLKEQKTANALQKANVDLRLAQIKPHFLYNALMSIQTIVLVDPQYGYDLIGSFSQYLRSVVDSITVDTLIPFSKELDNIKAYLAIEEMRYQDRLSVEYELMKQDFSVVPLSVQPIVENCVKHGMTDRVLHIRIKTYEDEAHYYVRVEDDGKGFDTAVQEQERSAGMNNVRYRVQTQMHGELQVRSAVGEGTKVTIILPRTA